MLTLVALDTVCMVVPVFHVAPDDLIVDLFEPNPVERFGTAFVDRRAVTSSVDGLSC